MSSYFIYQNRFNIVNFCKEGDYTVENERLYMRKVANNFVGVILERLEIEEDVATNIARSLARWRPIVEVMEE